MTRNAHGAPCSTENEKRAERAFRAVLAYAEDEDIEAGIYDMLADILHLCDQYGIDQDDAQRVARHHYNAERLEAVAS